MFAIVCLFWVGLKLSAPTWYFVILFVWAFMKLIEALVKAYKEGSKLKLEGN